LVRRDEPAHRSGLSPLKSHRKKEALKKSRLGVHETSRLPKGIIYHVASPSIPWPPILDLAPRVVPSPQLRRFLSIETRHRFGVGKFTDSPVERRDVRVNAKGSPR